MPMLHVCIYRTADEFSDERFFGASDHYRTNLLERLNPQRENKARMLGFKDKKNTFC